MIILTAHAEEQLQARDISRELVLDTAENPQQRISGHENRDILQSRYFDVVEGRQMLIRLITDGTGENVIVISVYKTSKFAKYWSEG